jgi:uncharacterized surface protein with fasciclin (FAS1) repeats
MDINFLTQISQRLLILIGVMSMGTLLVSPASANDSMDSSTEMSQMEINQSNSEAGNIVDVASSNQQFSTLAQALEAAGLTAKLSASDSDYTVFAPTNEAFNQLPEGALEYLLQPENKEVLQRVLSYHVVPEEVESDEITGGEVATLDGGVTTEVTDQGVTVNNASVITPDIDASNGVIHAVNRVLLPADLQSTLAAELGVEEQDLYQ